MLWSYFSSQPGPSAAGALPENDLGTGAAPWRPWWSGTGWKPPEDIQKNWTEKHMDWIKRQVHFNQPTLQAAFLDYVHEVEHADDRLQRPGKSIDDTIAAAPTDQEVVQLYSRSGVGKIVGPQRRGRTRLALSIQQPATVDELQRHGLQ
jgi:hypothetical protein